MIPAADTPECSDWCRTLQLSPIDASRAARLQALRDNVIYAGSWPDSSMASQGQAERESAREPTTPVLCRSCGRRYPLLTYLVEFLTAYKAPLPICCREPAGSQQPDLSPVSPGVVPPLPRTVRGSTC